MLEIVVGIGSLVLGATISYVGLKNSCKNKFMHYELEAKAKAKAIENEIEVLLKEANIKIKEREIEQTSTFQKRLTQVDERERNLMLQTKEYTTK